MYTVCKNNVKVIEKKLEQKVLVVKNFPLNMNALESYVGVKE